MVKQKTSKLKVNINLTLEDERQLRYLTDKFGENVTQVMKRALNDLYNKEIGKKPC
jgi:hypothetical protein